MLKKIWDGLITLIWMLIVLVWPVLQWLISLYCVLLMMRMFYYWNEPDMNAGWTFLGYFTLLVALNVFVSEFRPKGFDVNRKRKLNNQKNFSR